MAIDIFKIIKLIEEIVSIEKTIEKEIRKVKDAKKRKALRKAFADRDSAAIRSLLFDL